MLEKLRFQQLLEETLTVKRVPRAMSMYQFVLAMVLAAYVGFSRLYHLRFVARDRTASKRRVRSAAPTGGDDFCTRRLGILLLGCGGCLPRTGRALHHL